MSAMVDIHLIGADGSAAEGAAGERLRIDGAADPDAPAPVWSAIALTAPDSAPPPGTVASYRALAVEAKPGRIGTVAMIALITKKQGITREEAFRHWNDHIALANVVHHKALRYRQYRIGRSLDDAADDFMGLAALDFADDEALATGIYRNGDDVRLIAEDVDEFIDEAVAMIGAWC